MGGLVPRIEDTSTDVVGKVNGKSRPVSSNRSEFYHNILS